MAKHSYSYQPNARPQRALPYLRNLACSAWLCLPTVIITILSTVVTPAYASNQPLAVINAAQHATEYIAFIPSHIQATRYGYDETAAKTLQIDPLGRSTTWTVDAAGRITERKLQDGSTESTRYDQEGNRISKTLFSGQQHLYQYDPQNRLTSAVSPEGVDADADLTRNTKTQ